MHRLAPAFAVALLVAGPALAQNATYLPTPVPAPRTISVSGTAEVEVVPDRVEIVLGVETKSAELAAATRENDARVRRVIAFLRESGVPADRIQTDWVAIHPVYHENDTRRLDYYQVQKSIVATLSELSKFDAVLAGSVERGITHVLGVTFRTSELRRHKDDARDRATRAAREKAERLATALGSRLGAVQSLHENTWGGWYGGMTGGGGFGRGAMPMPYQQNVAIGAGNAAGEEGGASAPGRIQVSARVDATFALQ